MGIFDIFKKKKKIKEQETKTKIIGHESQQGYITEEEKQEKLSKWMLKQLDEFFPKSGVWYSHCFSQPKELSHANLPCHLRDTNWMASLFGLQLSSKGFFVPHGKIKKFMDTSKTFEKLRHDYELRIVKWQIEWMAGNGENWLMPEGFDEFSLMFSEDTDVMFRGGVVKTLTRIGMNREVIEEGIEKNADLWRTNYMLRGFNNEYDPICSFLTGTILENPSLEHKSNWLKLREYNYYQKHKDSVDKYGTPTTNMLISEEEAKTLKSTVEKQNAERKAYIEKAKQNRVTKKIETKTNDKNDGRNI